MQLVVPPDNWWCHPSYDVTFGSVITHDLSRLDARPHQSIAPWHYKMWKCFWGSGHSSYDAEAMVGVPDRSQNPSTDLTIDRRARRLIVRSIVGCHDWYTIDRRIPRYIVRSIDAGYPKSYDFLRWILSSVTQTGVDRATTRTTNRSITYHHQKDRSQYATIVDLSHVRQIATNRRIRCDCGFR